VHDAVRLRIEFDAEWSPRKIQMVSMDLVRDLRLYGGVSNISQIVDVSKAAPEPPKPKLYLTCRRYDRATKQICGEAWEADSFAPCPKCGQRQWVSKAEAPKSPPEEAQPESIDPLGAI
jgi:hypothetical protein